MSEEIAKVEEGGETSLPDWKSSLSEDLRDNPTIKDIPDIDTLAKNLIDAQSYIGSTIRKPKADEGKEVIDEYIGKLLSDDVTKDVLMLKPNLTGEDGDNFFRSIGKPADPDGYTIPEFEGIDVRADFLSNAKKEAFELNLTDTQFNSYVDKRVKESVDGQKTAKEQHDLDIAGLRDELGSSFDSDINLAIDFAVKSGVPEPLKSILTSGQADSKTLKYFIGLSKNVGGEGVVIADQEGGAGNNSPTEINHRISGLQKKISDIESNLTYEGRGQVRELSAEILKLRGLLAAN
jgi:hypothetical protein